jgi:NTE family protein
MKSPAVALALVPFLLLLAGCAHHPINARLTQFDPDRGYYFHNQHRTNNADNVLFIVTFSGGGTRAAALACGVLEELKRTSIPGPNGPHRLLDEVDAISSVSGGSVTAAAYALYGDAAFGQLETYFLKRNIQRQLFTRVINPINWPKLFSSTYERSDLAAEYYDKILFKGARFGDLLGHSAPYLIINATDISTGARFDFTQYQFDLICSDLGLYPLSRAVAASSAVPAVLSPITINNYAGWCGCEPPAWLETSLTNTAAGRLRFHAQEVRSYLDSTNRPYLHLVDGGVSDNLGLRAILDSLFVLEASPDIDRHAELERIDKVVILVVNAYSSPEKDWDRKPSPPGLVELLLAGATIPIDRYSSETIELLKEQVLKFRAAARARRLARGGDPSVIPDISFYPIVVGFSDIKDPVKRHFFLDQPTSFHLPRGSVDRLRSVAGELMRESPVYQQLLHDLSR